MNRTSERPSGRPNILFVTLDQLRADSLSCAGHPLVRTPSLDALAAEGVRFARHYAGAAPCSPGRAALYTGTYQMNNRVVGNGTPLDDRFDNVARVVRRAGYEPVLFGYTDQAVDPRLVDDPDDPRLVDYEGILPGFDEGLHLTGTQAAWLAHLAELGYPIEHVDTMLETEHERPEQHSVTTFLTDRVLDWFDAREASAPWFVHVSYLRPHPPYDAPGSFATRYDPADCPPPVPMDDDRHPMHELFLHLPIATAPTDPAELAALQAHYWGMVSHADEQLGRVLEAIRARGEWDDTVVVVTSDHGEQLGDQGLLQKLGWFESSYRIPAIVRDPRHPAGHGTVVERFTEAVDVLPTICEAVGADIPLQCDGLPLTPFLRGEEPPWWRSAAHYEWDWREWFVASSTDRWPWDRRLERYHLVVQRSDERAYVHFGDGTSLCYDLATDPTWRTRTDDPVVLLHEAQALLHWQGEHRDRTMTGTLIANGVVGRRPPGHPGDPATFAAGPAPVAPSPVAP